MKVMTCKYKRGWSTADSDLYMYFGYEDGYFKESREVDLNTQHITHTKFYKTSYKIYKVNTTYTKYFFGLFEDTVNTVTLAKECPCSFYKVTLSCGNTYIVEKEAYEEALIKSNPSKL